MTPKYILLTLTSSGWLPVLDTNGDLQESEDFTSLLASVSGTFPDDKIKLVEALTFNRCNGVIEVVGGSTSPSKVTSDAVDNETPSPGDEI